MITGFQLATGEESIRRAFDEGHQKIIKRRPSVGKHQKKIIKRRASEVEH